MRRSSADRSSGSHSRLSRRRPPGRHRTELNGSARQRHAATQTGAPVLDDEPTGDTPPSEDTATDTSTPPAKKAVRRRATSKTAADTPDDAGTETEAPAKKAPAKKAAAKKAAPRKKAAAKTDQDVAAELADAGTAVLEALEDDPTVIQD